MTGREGMRAEPRPDRGGDARPARQIRAAAEHEAQDAALQSAPRLGPAPQGLRDDATLAGFGRALPPALRMAEERRLGLDLSAVRLHDDAAAGDALADHGARALARGQEIALLPADARADTPDTARLLRHEIGHVAQQSRPGAAPMIQREGGEGRGIGRSPPDAPFVTVEGTGVEDDHALFARDSADLTPAARSALAAAAEGRTGEIVVHIHGYASLEGDDTYNRNLSAHRAVAIRDALAPLLPEGTRFTLYAHGETDAFGEPARNRRAGVDFITPEEGGLTLSGPLSLFPRPRPWARLLDPGALVLNLDLPDLQSPRVPLPGDLTPADLGLTPEGDPGYGPRRPPQPTNLWVQPPPIWPRGYDFTETAQGFAIRGVPLTLGHADDISTHFEFWRLRFFQLGLPADLADQAAQMGTDIMVGTHLSNNHPFRHEELDRQFGTEPPPSFTILNETRMMKIFDTVSGWFKKESDK
ncbi:DUF4157 domain-containing protein [Paracoccaceae bacterium Fryx2]|nr:DUF4157 domain-containing protein [Paracoccaceae bacterium Fryx2]